MSYLIHFLKFLFIFAGWIPVIFHFFNKNKSIVTMSYQVLLSEIIISFFIVEDFSFIFNFKVQDIYFGIIIGGILFILEYGIGSGILKKKVLERKKVPVKWLLIFVVSPFIEEIYFRVVPYEILLNFDFSNMNFTTIYIFISTTTVVINHFQSYFSFNSFLQKFLIEGIFMTLVFIYFESIWINIIAHFIFNMINYHMYYKLYRRKRVE